MPATNVLYITVDQWRGDCLGAAGHPVVKTPNLDRLAARGVRFANHWTVTAPCGPSRASLHTGLYLMNHRSVNNGTPLDDRFTNIAREARAVAALGLRSTWLDGEIVVQREDGTPDFNALQNAIDAGPGRRSAPIRYFVFDLPFNEGHDLRGAPLFARRALLRECMEAHAASHARGGRADARDGGPADGQAGGHGDDDPVRFSADFAADPWSLLESARALGLEGIIAKRADAPYVSRRSDTWLKLKVGARQELVVGGFTERQGSAREIGSLILGAYDADGRLEHAGSVGTGWDAAGAARLRERLAPLEVKTPPFAAGSPDPGRWSRRAAGSERWVKPELVAEVRFAGWTPAGQVPALAGLFAAPPPPPPPPPPAS